MFFLILWTRLHFDKTMSSSSTVLEKERMDRISEDEVVTSPKSQVKVKRPPARLNSKGKSRKKFQDEDLEAALGEGEEEARTGGCGCDVYDCVYGCAWLCA